MQENTEITVKEAYEKIDAAVNEFAEKFGKMLPNQEATKLNNVVIMNHIVALKEMGKFSINTYVASEIRKEKNEAGEQ